mgnify:CR=1 FL=1
MYCSQLGNYLLVHLVWLDSNYFSLRTQRHVKTYTMPKVLLLMHGILQCIVQEHPGQYQGGLERHLPERERLNVTSCSHIGGKPQKLTFQVCLQTSELPLKS